MEHGADILIAFIRLFAGNRIFCHPEKFAGFDLDYIAVFPDAFYSAVNTADGNNPVSDLEVVQEILVFLLSLALRTDNQEIKDTEEYHHEEYHVNRTAAIGPIGGCGAAREHSCAGNRCQA